MTEEEREMLESMEDSSGGGGPDKKKLIRIGMLVGIVLIQVAAAWAVARFLILPKLPGDGEVADSSAVVEVEEVDPADRERGTIVMMDDVVVNLTTMEGTRFLKVTTGLEFSDKKLETEITERMPELRAMLIDQLSCRTAEDVISRKGRELVKTEILEEFNQNLQQGDLLNIYFSDFVVQ